MRIRGFTQDDSRLYVAPEQPLMRSRAFGLCVVGTWAFGFDDFTFHLSTKDSDKYVGSDEI